MRMANAIAEQGSEAYKDMAVQISKIDADEQAKKRLDNLRGSLEQLKGTVSVLAIEIGAKLGEKIRPVIDGLVFLLNNFRDVWATLPGPVKSVIETIAGVAAVIGTVVFAVGAFGMVAPMVLSALSTITSAVGMVGTALTFLMTNPVGLVIA